MVDDQATGEPSDPRTVTEAPVSEAPVTGDTAVDDAVACLADLPLLPLDEHPAVYEGVHRTLTDRLADVEG